MPNIVNIEKTEGGWIYTLDTPPAGGWDIFLNGERLKSRVTDATYTYSSALSFPPPIEVIRPDLTTASHYADNEIILWWLHSGADYYLIQYSADNSLWIDLKIYPYSGGVRQSIIERDLYADSQRYYQAIPGVMQNDVFVATGDPVTVHMRRASVPPPYKASLSYNATTRVLSVDGEIREGI
jgi:hypothetical protein